MIMIWNRAHIGEFVYGTIYRDSKPETWVWDLEKEFFMDEIDPLLEMYEPGQPKMKPDVLKQIAQIEKDRDKMMQEEMAKNGQIMLNQPGKPPVIYGTRILRPRSRLERNSLSSVT